MEMLEDVLPCEATLTVNAMAVKAANPSWYRSTWNPGACQERAEPMMHAHIKAPTTKATWALFVFLNSVEWTIQQLSARRPGLCMAATLE